ncbi:thioredoxin family protein [Pseudomonadota bacterium]|nr:thioredoxin family protein [Pseudomonadota bacterium]MDC0198979.1 thioredoxin family protein [Pseudomonadota bacterium]
MNLIIDLKEYPNLPHPEPYSGAVVTEHDLKKFIEITIHEDKQPIVIFGANWCPDAKLLEGVMQLPTVKTFLETRSNILHIDVGTYEINTELFNFFDQGIQDGIPRIFIMDKVGKNINLQANDDMRKARELSTQDIFNYFQEFVTKA